MKILGLDDKEYSLSLSSSTSNTSKLHNKARELLVELYPFDRIFENITLPGSKTQYRKSLLFADFLILSIRTMVEVQGEQHYKFNAHFFQNKMEFFKAQARDRDKKKWCEINNICLIEL